jgi:predicted choloylglycine hydrolase
MQLTFEAVAEAQPGPKWQALFNQNWPDYRTWFLARGGADGPTVAQSLKQLRRFMPEIVPTYERIVELAGGGDLAARLLSFYRPPAYLLGCSQAVRSRPDGAMLIRNYDLDPGLNEGIIFHTQWNGRKVLATNEFLWGVADGINDTGLALSLAFGGRKVVGEGFGIPLILRYILEFCETTADAIKVLRRVPSHMAYNVTLLDRAGHYATVLVAPDRPAQVTRKPVATNHQKTIEWPEQARFSKTLERERFLNERLANTELTEQELIQSFLHAPLYSRNYKHGFGTLYTAVYRPEQGTAEFHWPDGIWLQSLDHFREGKRLIRYSQTGETVTQPADGCRGRDWTGWEPADLSLAGIFRQTVNTLLDSLTAAGIPLAAKPVDEFLEELDRTGQVPWHKLGTIWAGSDGSWSRESPPQSPPC